MKNIKENKNSKILKITEKTKNICENNLDFSLLKFKIKVKIQHNGSRILTVSVMVT